MKTSENGWRVTFLLRGKACAIGRLAAERIDTQRGMPTLNETFEC